MVLVQIVELELGCIHRQNRLEIVVQAQVIEVREPSH
jgi:hypothetical protein